MKSEDKNYILKELTGYPKAHEITNVMFAFSKPYKNDAYIHPRSRIIIVLTGSYKMRIGNKDAIKEITIAPGDALWCEPRSYIFQEACDCLSISVVFFENYIRFVISSRKSNLNECKAWYHTSQGLGRVGNHILQAMLAMHEEKHPRQIEPAILKSLLILCLEKLRDDIPSITGKGITTYHMVLDYVNSNFQYPISRKSVAEELRINQSHISRLFQNFGEYNFNNLLKRLRMNYAAELLKNSNRSIDEIAMQSGFSSANYFSKVFKCYFGVNPVKYKHY